MKKLFKKLTVLATVAVLGGCFVACSFPTDSGSGQKENNSTSNTDTTDDSDNQQQDNNGNNETEENGNETKEPEKKPSPIKNFTVKQKEGTNFLIFSWEKLEGYDEISYDIHFENGPYPEGLSEHYKYKGHAYESWEDNRILRFKTKESYKEFFMFDEKYSGNYTFSIKAHKTRYYDSEKHDYIDDSDFESDEILTASVEYTHLIRTPDLKIIYEALTNKRLYGYKNSDGSLYEGAFYYANDARFVISSTLLMSGNKYCMVYVGLTDNISEAIIVDALNLDLKEGRLCDVSYSDEYGENDEHVEIFEIECPFYNPINNNYSMPYNWDSKTTYYMWLKLADEYVYDSNANYKRGGYVDSDTYGPASNVVEFKFEVEE